MTFFCSFLWKSELYNIKVFFENYFQLEIDVSSDSFYQVKTHVLSSVA
jgi:hypothetical protein